MSTTTETPTEGWCVVCGGPFAQISAYTDERGVEKFVHDRCYREYARRLLLMPIKEDRDDPD